VESGDIFTVLGGLVLVLVIALVVNPQYLAGLQSPLSKVTPAATPIILPETVVTAYRPTPVSTPPTPATPAPLLTIAPPYRIYYTDKPFSYPAFKLPERLDTFGESDVMHSGQPIVSFAYIEDTRGGLTQVFSVPYPVWMMNITVIANTTPQLGNFRMALCYAKNGTILDGVEVLNQGTSYKKIQTSNVPLYLIISTTSIDRYRIELETSREYYSQFRAR
jgi:hypothetical protein